MRQVVKEILEEETKNKPQDFADLFDGINIPLQTELMIYDSLFPEYTEETITVDGKERPVYNSEGNRIAKSKEALINFYKWFGDSKVVDEQGRPLVVYHGGGKFDTFKYSYDGTYYFTTNKEYAERYANDYIDERGRKGLGELKAVYLKIENPAPQDVMDRGTLDQVIAQGYDGHIFDDVLSENDDKIIRVFESNQIKSVDNRGTFSLEEDNIYLQSAMKRSRFQTFDEFYNYSINRKETDEKYQFNAITKDGLNLRVPQDVIRHDVNRHDLTAQDWEYLLKNIDNVKSAIVSNKKPRFSGKPLLIKVNVGNKYYGIAIEIFKKNNPIITSAFEDNEKSIDNWIKNEAIPSGQKTTFSDNRLIDIIAQIEPDFKTYFLDDSIQYQDKSGKTPRGAYYNNTIFLFNEKDRSTFMHETAHRFRQELIGYSSNSRIKEMLQTLNKWEQSEFTKRYELKELNNGKYAVFDKNGLTVYDNNGNGFIDEIAAERYAKEEIFARGYEQYLREGKAPSNYLKRVFDTFTKWLKNLYKTAQDLNVEINDEVRAIYSELLGGKDVDFWLSQPIDAIVQETNKRANEEREKLNEIYSKTIQLKQGNLKFSKTRRTLQDFGKGLKNFLSDSIVPLEEEIKGISQDIFNLNRPFILNKTIHCK